MSEPSKEISSGKDRKFGKRNFLKPDERAASPVNFTDAPDVPAGVGFEEFMKHRLGLSILLNGYFVSWMTAVYQQFGGDLTMALVYAVVYWRNMDQIQNYLKGSYAINRFELRIKPCNAQSIKDVTGIPRETVKRKLNKLKLMHLVSETGEGLYFCTAEAQGKLKVLNYYQAKSLLELAEQVQRYLKD